jgi:translation initiation factor IF-1
MSEKETISWIFLATALATEKEPTDIRGIFLLADGINHTVPTHKEMQYSLAWLQKNDLVTVELKKYNLTSKGKLLFDSARQSGKLLDIWRNLEDHIGSCFEN